MRYTLTSILASICIIGELFCSNVQAQQAPIRHLNWSPAGDKIAVGGFEELRVYDATTFQQISSINIDPQLSSMDWSSDGGRLALLLGDGVDGDWRLEIRETSNLTVISTYQDNTTSAVFPMVDWSPDGNFIAINLGIEIRILDSNSLQLLRVLSKPSLEVTSMAWYPNSTKLASTNGKELLIWDTTQATLLNTLTNSDTFDLVSLRPDGLYFAIVRGQNNRDIEIWDASTLQPVQLLEGEDVTVTHLTWGLGGLASSLRDGRIKIWEPINDEIINIIDTENFLNPISWEPNAANLAYFENGAIQLALISFTCNSTQTVSNSAELISAITSANANPDASVIGLAAGTYTFTAANNPLNALPAITSDITICSTEGATLTRQAGSALFGFFEVNAGGSLTLENLTLNGGDVGNDTGGALVNEGGTVTLNNVTFSNNHANTGGAIDNESGSLTITDSTFQNNQATFGGAIDNDAGNTLSITGATFTSNTAQNDGGAIHNDGGILTVTDSTFTSNTATRYGGALDNTGQATLSSSTFSGNTAAWSGGAIRNTNTLTVNNGSVLENNAATVGGNGEGWGGGVYNASDATATLSGVTLSENEAIQGGGIRNHGSLTLNENMQLTGNSASHRGGGIYNAGGSITLTNSALLNNTATGDGGAIYVTSTGSEVTITGSTVSGNTSGASGGAIRNSQSMTITDSVFSNNTATSNYGSLYLTSSSTTTAHNSCFSGNSATSVGFTGTTMQDFTGNWWGAANGPSGSGSGSGDAVNNKINFANFLTAGCPHP